MSERSKEIEKRKNAALKAIKLDFEDNEREYGVFSFINHHLEDVPEEYWIKHFGIAKPEPKQVLNALVLRSHWDEEDDEGIEMFDFTLPDDVTNYVICVSFDESGVVEDISIES